MEQLGASGPPCQADGSAPQVHINGVGHREAGGRLHRRDAAGKLDASLRQWQRVNQWADRVILWILVLLAAAACGLALEQRLDTARGNVAGDAVDFDALRAVNPDIVAWLTLTDTPIDHPVVQGKDNFEYLDKAFDGSFYAGGTLFLDAAGTPDFSDRYSIIHGHHMAGGAMFGSLEHFLKPAYAAAHERGMLRTPAWDWDLEFLLAGIFDAYDSEIYTPGEQVPKDALRKERGVLAQTDTTVKQHTGKTPADAEGSEENQVLALSTCAGDMSDDRIVVFWKMTNRREHDKETQ